MAWESAQLFEKARFMEGSEIWISFRRIWISFRRTLILFRLVLISFRRILNSFHAPWRLERGAARIRFGVAEKDLHLQRAERFNEVVRAHWGVENRLHWRLDVVMNEDQDRSRLENGP